MNYKQIMAIKARHKEEILKVCPGLPNTPGIYVFYRIDENGFKFCYVGQSVKMLDRCVQHLQEYDHIALSLKKHKLYDKNKFPFGWKLGYKECSRENLDTLERNILSLYHKEYGFSPYNRTTGGQDGEKTGISENKPARGYYDGKKQGYEDARKQIKAWFDKSLSYQIKGKENKNKQKAYERFSEFLGENNNDTERENS